MTEEAPKKRTRRADGAATRQRILETAGELFADSGLAETTNKQIAARAEVDLASINYHFGSRGDLYQAVLAEAHRRLLSRSDLERIVATAAPPEKRLRALLAFLLGATQREVHWPVVLLGREIMSPSSHFRTLQQEEILPKLQALLPMLSEITGIAADDPVLLRCLPAIAAPCAFFILLGRAPSPLVAELGSADPDEVVEQLHTYAMGGLLAVSRWHGAENGAPSGHG